MTTIGNVKAAPATKTAAAKTPAAPRKVSAARVDDKGNVFATIDGKEAKLATNGQKAWVLGNGRFVAWSGADGSGGYENEGQSLRVFDVQKRTWTKVLSEYFMVDDVKAVTTSKGKTAFVVSMCDGGLGGSHLAVVDPARGEVFRSQLSKATAVKGDALLVGHFKEDDFAMSDAPTKPYKTDRLDLNEVLGRKLIVNKRDLP